MRILVCNWKDIRHPAAGGAEVFVHEVARHWAMAGHDVVFYAAASRDLPQRECIDSVNVVRGGSRVSVYSRARQFYERSGTGAFDAVLDVVNTRPFGVPNWRGSPPSVALIYQVANEVWDHEFPGPLAGAGRKLEKRWLRPYTNAPVVTISHASRESLWDYGLKNVSLIPVGLTRPIGVTPAPRLTNPILLFVGRLVSNKRPDHAIEAFDRARKKIPDLQLWIVGTGPLEEPLVRRWGADEAIHFFGRVTDAEKFALMAAADALLVTSVREGWGMVVSEAAAVGTPTIGYDVPGLCESVQQGGGVLVPPDVDDLALEIAARLPAWAAGDKPDVQPGGTADWSEVADQLLEHLGRVQRTRC